MPVMRFGSAIDGLGAAWDPEPEQRSDYLHDLRLLNAAF